MTDKKRNMCLVCNALDRNVRVIDLNSRKEVKISIDYGAGIVLNNLLTEAFETFAEVYGCVTK